jgi:dihydropyrimidinase
MVIDFALQSQGHTMREALDTWKKKSDGKACIDFSLHMAVTDLGPGDGARGLREMEEMVAEGISSFKLFMAYPGVLMIDDGLMFRVMQKAAQLNALCCIHAENGSAVRLKLKPKPRTERLLWPIWLGRRSISSISPTLLRSMN